MGNSAITTDAIFTSFRTRADRSLGFSGVTPEMEDEGMLAFLGIRQQEVKMVIQPKHGDIGKLVTIKGEFDAKSPSQRLHAALFVLHRQLTVAQKIAIPFEAFYLDNMNRMIQSVKDQLEPATF